MPQATITPAFINAPKPGARSGSIKDETGEYWGIRPEDMGLFQRGVPAEIEYTEREYQGKIYKNIHKARIPAPRQRRSHKTASASGHQWLPRMHRKPGSAFCVRLTRRPG
jgi:hypothetical protein